MYAFEYHRPHTLSGALADLAKADAKALAGGQTLLPTMKQRLAQPSALIELKHVPELNGVSRDGDTIVIGAMTRHIDVNQSPVVKGAIPGARRARRPASATLRCATAARSAARSPTTIRPPTIPPPRSRSARRS